MGLPDAFVGNWKHSHNFARLTVWQKFSVMLSSVIPLKDLLIQRCRPSWERGWSVWVSCFSSCKVFQLYYNMEKQNAWNLDNIWKVGNGYFLNLYPKLKEMCKVSVLYYAKCLEKWSCVFQFGYLEIMATPDSLSLFAFSHKMEIIAVCILCK